MPSVDIQTIQKLLGDHSCRIHLIGVAGSGMSGLAILLLQQGFMVSGSDLKRSNAVENLVKLGLIFFEGQAEQNVSDARLVVYSSAVRPENVERAMAEKLGIMTVRRADVLNAISTSKHQLLVTGTHGKTTSSAMLAGILRQQEASYYVGAEVPSLGLHANWAHGKEIVIEADESDGSLEVYNPYGMLVLNIEPEHLDYFKSFDEALSLFQKTGKKAQQFLVYCHDNPEALRLFKDFYRGYSYGFNSDAMYHIADVEQGRQGSRFKVFKHGEFLTEVSLKVPGIQNISNATGVVACADQLGVSMQQVKDSLAEFRGARRRFEVLFEDESYMIVDDYAHHPSEIKATLAAAKTKKHERILAVFQPHRYTRTQHLGKEIAQAFEDADIVYFTDIYAASESPIEGVNAEMLMVECQNQRTAFFEKNLMDLKVAIATALQPGDLVVVMGAGDVGSVAHSLTEDLKLYSTIKKMVSVESVVRPLESMHKHVSMRVGGPAQVWFEPCCDEDLAKVVSHCHEQKVPITMIGRGTNLIVKDHGIRGVCIHLGHPHFREIKVNGLKICAGAGARLRQVVMEAKKAGIGGFEFAEGIPATLGGALRMNAGAMGGWIFDVVESVKCLDSTGRVLEFSSKDLEVHYRSVPLLRTHIALSAVMKGHEEDSKAIANRLKNYSEKRWESQPAAPSAGCIFKNPEGMAAGMLIDQLGLKNIGCGGAKVSQTHANFIVNEGAAKAKDILNLIKIIQETVKRERGIELETEVIVLGE